MKSVFESDERLFERLRRGDLAAFATLYQRYERRLFGFIRAFLDDAAEAEDVMHEVFMALLGDRAPGPDDLHLRAWLYQCARNASLNRLRTRRRGEAARAREAAERPAPAPLPSEAIERGEAAEALRRAVSRLPPTLRELYHLRASGMSYEGMAQLLGIPIGTVKSRMHEMVATLKREMQPWIASG
jgi:RNA polymerase sigma-70 factor (ECF subfamily)